MTNTTNALERLSPAGLFCVGLPDTQGGMCWLAGYESDPTRYYTPSCALTFETWQAAADAIERAKKTHPFKERTYRIMTVAEMETQNDKALPSAGPTPNIDMTPTTTTPIEQQRLVQAWAADPDRIFHVPKYDGTNEDEPVKVLRFVAICQSTTGGLYVYGLDNNVETLERLESLNETALPEAGRNPTPTP